VLSKETESGSFAGRHISPLLLAQYFGKQLVSVCRVWWWSRSTMPSQTKLSCLFVPNLECLGYNHIWYDQNHACNTLIFQFTKCWKLTRFRSTEVRSRETESGSFAGRHISPLLLAQYFGEMLVSVCWVWWRSRNKLPSQPKHSFLFGPKRCDLDAIASDMTRIMPATHSYFNPQNVEIKTILLDRGVLKG